MMCDIHTVSAVESWGEVGARIRQARLASQLSQAELASALGIDRTALARAEGGQRQVSALELFRLSEVLHVPIAHFVTRPPAAVVSQTGNLVTWWTGNALMVFDGGNLTQRYTIAPGDTAAPLGPGVMMAGQLLVPVTGAIGVYDPVSGESSRYITVDRPPSTEPVFPVVSGSRVIEQRGDTVVALG